MNESNSNETNVNDLKPARIKRHRLTEKQAEELVRSILAASGTQTEIGRRFGVQQPFVSDVKNGRRWARLQSERVYSPKKQRPEITNQDIIQYDPMIRLMVNTHILRYWSGGNTISTLDPRATISRLGMSVEDLIQCGRIWVMEQTRYLKKCRGSRARVKGPKAKVSSMMYTHLQRKYISLSKSFAAERHGGQVVGVEDNRLVIQELIDALGPDTTPVIATGLLREALTKMTNEVRKILEPRLFAEDGSPKWGSLERLLDILRSKVSDAQTQHLDADDEIVSANLYEDVTPETYLLAKEEITRNARSSDLEPSRTVRVRRTNSRGRLRIFDRAVELGLPSTQTELAKLIGRSPGTISNILNGHSASSPEVRDRIQELFGESIESLRQVVGG